MLATFAEWEREIIRERIADQRGAIKVRGERSAGRVPLGYRAAPATKQLVIDKRVAAAVRWLFTEAAKGTTTNDLVKKANKKKLASKQWTSRTVLRLLTNPTYAGRRPDGTPGMHEPMIAPELFEPFAGLSAGTGSLRSHGSKNANACESSRLRNASWALSDGSHRPAGNAGTVRRRAA